MKPKSIDNNTLTVYYDEEFESLHAERVIEHLVLVKNCMTKITGINGFSLKVEKVKGLVTPVAEVKKVDLKKVREQLSNNAFVQKTIELFDGSIVDIRG